MAQLRQLWYPRFHRSPNVRASRLLRTVCVVWGTRVTVLPTNRHFPTVPSFE